MTYKMNKITKSIIALCVLSPIGLFLTSCEISDNPVSNSEQDIERIPGVDTPTTEQDENSTVTYQFSEAVAQLSQYAQHNYLAKVEKDSILFFLPETPDSIMPEVGEIISSRISDKLPYGLGNKVISRTEENGLVKIVTSVAPLDEIFEELDVKSEISIEGLISDSKGVYDEDGNYYEINIVNLDDVLSDEIPSQARWQTRAAFGSNKIIEIPIKSKTSDGFYSEFKILIGCVMTFNKDKNDFLLSFEPSIGFTGDFGTKSEISDDGDMKKIMTLLKKIKVFSGHLPIAGGLIDLRPFGTLQADLFGKIEGSASFGINYVSKFKCGWTNRGFFKENTSSEPTDFFRSLSIKGKAEVGPELSFNLGCGLYTEDVSISLNTKPSLMIGAELEASHDLIKNKIKIDEQKINMDLNLALDAKGKVGLFGATLFEDEVNIAKWNLLHKEWPLFPSFINDSFNIQQKNITGTRNASHSRGGVPSTFIISYSLSGGKITKAMGSKPAVIVEKDNKEVKRIVSDIDAFTSEQTNLNFEIPDLEEGVDYKAFPCIIIDKDVYNWDSKNFSSSSDDVNYCPDENHPHAIDLGLPSGTKWACCELGASNPTDLGAFFAYGETKEKSQYTFDNYEYILYNSTDKPNEEIYPRWTYNGSTGYYYVIEDLGTNISGTEYDSARQIWGNPWCIPTKDQCQELLDNCSIETGVITRYGYLWDGTPTETKFGYKLTGPNGNSILINNNHSFYGVESYPEGAGLGWWTASKEISGAYWLYIYERDNMPYFQIHLNGAQWNGLLIRPVSQ